MWERIYRFHKGRIGRRVVAWGFWGVAFFGVGANGAAQAAPARSGTPYAEATRCGNSRTLMCEDFNKPLDVDITPGAGGGNGSFIWRNPGISKRDGSRPMTGGGSSVMNGASVQRPTIPVPGVSDTDNYVLRIAKSGSGFTDVFTGRNTGTGHGNISGWLTAAGNLSSGWNPHAPANPIKTFNVRYQQWVSNSFTWPSEDPNEPSGGRDLKGPFLQPTWFADNPSAGFQFGQVWFAGLICRDVDGTQDKYYPRGLSIRYGKTDVWGCSSATRSFAQWPACDELCPAKPLGAAPTPGRIFQFESNRWYTVEVHTTLCENTNSCANSKLRAWVDGVKVYSITGRKTCDFDAGFGTRPVNLDSCLQGLGYLFTPGFMGTDTVQTGYMEIDNLVISDGLKIGVPGGDGPLPPPGMNAPRLLPHSLTPFDPTHLNVDKASVWKALREWPQGDHLW